MNWVKVSVLNSPLELLSSLFLSSFLGLCQSSHS